MLPPPAFRGIFRTDARARAAYSEGAGIYRIVPRAVALPSDPPPRTATTGAAVTLAQLNAAAATYGLRLPPDPSSGAWATLGGMVSTNAAGARSVRFGSVRRWVQGLTLITA